VGGTASMRERFFKEFERYGCNNDVHMIVNDN